MECFLFSPLKNSKQKSPTRKEMSSPWGIQTLGPAPLDEYALKLDLQNAINTGIVLRYPYLGAVENLSEVVDRYRRYYLPVFPDHPDLPKIYAMAEEELGNLMKGTYSNGSTSMRPSVFQQQSEPSIFRQQSQQQASVFQPSVQSSVFQPSVQSQQQASVFAPSVQPSVFAPSVQSSVFQPSVQSSVFQPSVQSSVFASSPYDNSWSSSFL